MLSRKEIEDIVDKTLPHTFEACLAERDKQPSPYTYYGIFLARAADNYATARDVGRFEAYSIENLHRMLPEALDDNLNVEDPTRVERIYDSSMAALWLACDNWIIAKKPARRKAKSA